MSKRHLGATSLNVSKWKDTRREESQWGDGFLWLTVKILTILRLQLILLVSTLRNVWKRGKTGVKAEWAPVITNIHPQKLIKHLACFDGKIWSHDLDSLVIKDTPYLKKLLSTVRLAVFQYVTNVN